MNFRVVHIGSTGGGVLSRLLGHAWVRALSLEAVSDRACGTLDVARAAGLPAVQLDAADGLAFSDALAARYRGRDDLVFLSFYTRLFRGDFLQQHAGRIFNCHPALLPAFKGMRGFEDTLASSSLFMGATLHQVDAEMDHGPAVIQAALPLDRSQPVADNRHRLFLAQVYSTLQFLRWLHDGRLQPAPQGARLAGARFQPGIYAPGLDADLFDFLGVPNELDPPEPAYP
jgi:phosphoribosylglycinamide formyltransferase-1